MDYRLRVMGRMKGGQQSSMWMLPVGVVLLAMSRLFVSNREWLMIFVLPTVLGTLAVGLVRWVGLSETWFFERFESSHSYRQNAQKRDFWDAMDKYMHKSEPLEKAAEAELDRPNWAKKMSLRLKKEEDFGQIKEPQNPIFTENKNFTEWLFRDFQELLTTIEERKVKPVKFDRSNGLEARRVTLGKASVEAVKNFAIQSKKPDLQHQQLADAHVSSAEKLMKEQSVPPEPQLASDHLFSTRLFHPENMRQKLALLQPEPLAQMPVGPLAPKPQTSVVSGLEFKLPPTLPVIDSIQKALENGRTQSPKPTLGISEWNLEAEQSHPQPSSPPPENSSPEVLNILASVPLPAAPPKFDPDRLKNMTSLFTELTDTCRNMPDKKLAKFETDTHEIRDFFSKLANDVEAHFVTRCDALTRLFQSALNQPQYFLLLVQQFALIMFEIVRGSSSANTIKIVF